MHIAHHLSASRNARYNRLLGGTVAGLSGLVASSIFVAALEGQNRLLMISAAVISLVTAILTGVNTSLGLAQKAEAHHNAAIGFQGLRREIEEELVRVRCGSERDSYENLRNRWVEALERALPLPQDLHRKAHEEFDRIHAG